MGKAGKRLIKAARQAVAAARGRKKAATAQDEVEITPAMLEAGLGEISTLNRYYETDEEAVTRIYEAMFLAGRGR